MRVERCDKLVTGCFAATTYLGGKASTHAEMYGVESVTERHQATLSHGWMGTGRLAAPISIWILGHLSHMPIVIYAPLERWLEGTQYWGIIMTTSRWLQYGEC
jgi:hypothetical protein